MHPVRLLLDGLPLVVVELQAYRFLQDSRDTATAERLADLDDHFSVFRCRGVGNCNVYCPRGLEPLKAIDAIKLRMLERGS